MRESLNQKAQRLERIYSILSKRYPDAGPRLIFSNALELLVASILAAQCTDDRVNKVTESLFRRYKTAADWANVPVEVLEQQIITIPMCRRKARQIQQCCRTLVEKHNGEVPANIEALTALKGVGRKTANLVLGNAFGIPGIVVDTHVARISSRLGLTANTDRDKIEQDLMKILPKERWTHLSHLFTFFGREVCRAKKPACAECPVSELCPSFGRV